MRGEHDTLGPVVRPVSTYVLAFRGLVLLGGVVLAGMMALGRIGMGIGGVGIVVVLVGAIVSGAIEKRKLRAALAEVDAEFPSERPK